MAHKSVFHWSGGKDCALALYHLLQDNQYTIGRLLTSVNASLGRITMHGVRTTLLDEQARCIGLPLQKLQLPEQPDMQVYNQLMDSTMAGLKTEGFTHAIYGDIFLEDLRAYREQQLAAQGFTASFPLWKRNTAELLQEFLDLGFKTIIVCVQANKLDKSFAGRIIDRDFIRELPKGVDPCGENGEFHTFVFDGPIFKYPVRFNIGEQVYRAYAAPKAADNSDTAPPQDNMGFWFCDLLPETKQ